MPLLFPRRTAILKYFCGFLLWRCDTFKGYGRWMSNRSLKLFLNKMINAWDTCYLVLSSIKQRKDVTLLKSYGCALYRPDLDCMIRWIKVRESTLKSRRNDKLIMLIHRFISVIQSPYCMKLFNKTVHVVYSFKIQLPGHHNYFIEHPLLCSLTEKGEITP